MADVTGTIVVLVVVASVCVWNIHRKKKARDKREAAFYRNRAKMYPS